VKRPTWAGLGDVNAFFGLMLDNIANLVLAVSLLPIVCGMSANISGSTQVQDFVIRKMIPGTALGVLVGDLIFFFIALRLIRRTGREDVTAMPLGIDTPSLFGMILFVLGPAFGVAYRDRGLPIEEALDYCWKIGMCSIITSGVFKIACSLVSGYVRRALPRAGLLGSLAAVALVLIAFMPLLEIASSPVVGFVSLAIVLTTLVARIELPYRIPGALAALAVGGTIHVLMHVTGTLGSEGPTSTFTPHLGLLLPDLSVPWWDVYRESLAYLPIVIPFALATVVGGIDCTESAAAAGDEYHTGQVIAVEGLATIAAGLCGGVIQTTPYIGHPAYKAMGGRSAYVLATALFIGGAGMLGYFGYLFQWIPQPAIYPVLVFIGLEITSQSYHATKQDHYPAVAIACMPALAYLITIYTDQILGTLMMSLADFETKNGHLARQLQTLQILSGGGSFILTGLLWSSGLAAIIDRRLRLSATFFAIAGVCSLFGVIHSPAKGGVLINPLSLPDGLPEGAMAGQTPIYLATAYGAMALVLAGWDLMATKRATDPLPTPVP